MQQGSPVATLATASTTSMEFAATALLGCRLRSLRDMIYHTRGVLSDAGRKYLTHLNAAYSLLGHDRSVDTRKRAARMFDRLSN